MLLAAPNHDGICRNENRHKAAIDQGENRFTSGEVQESGSQQLHKMLDEFSISSLMHQDTSRRIEDITNSISRCPEAVSARNSKGLLPIHIACQNGVPLAIVQYLLQVKPETVLSTTNDRRCMLPLHLVCRHFDGNNQEKTSIIRYLCRLSPKTIHLTTAKGETALHLICRNYFCTVKDIRCLYRLFPAALTVRSLKDGKTPLHIACEKQYMERKGRNPNGVSDGYPSSSSSDIVHFLIRKQPSALQMADSRGNFPLHSAVQGLQPTRLVMSVLRQYPRAAIERNRQGQTPLHLATLQPIPSQKTVEELYRTNWAAATMTANRGD